MKDEILSKRCGKVEVLPLYIAEKDIIYKVRVQLKS